MASSDYKDYHCTDAVLDIKGKRALQVWLSTAEFGVLKSEAVIKELIDTKSDSILFDKLADELIKEYEDRLKVKKKLSR